MKITIKTLQQKLFQIEAEGSDTVADLKSKIHDLHQEHSIESQKLIYSGKVLPDNKTVESCEIKEKDFLVLMVSKPKASAPSTSAAATSSIPTPVQVPPAVSQAALPQVAQPQPAPPSSTSTADTTPTTQAPAPGPATETSFLSGAALQSAISNITEMGFPRDQVMRAMKASYNNPDRAVEYLMTGIPEHLMSETSGSGDSGTAVPNSSTAAPVTAAPQPTTTAPPQQPPQQLQPQQQQQPQQPAAIPQNLFQLAQQQAAGGGGTGGANPLAGLRAGAGTGASAAAGAGSGLEGLRNNPSFDALRELVNQNPALLQPMIQELTRNNPPLGQILAQNPEALLQLLNERRDSEFEGGEGEEIPPGTQVVSVTAEERAAIERLEALGFPRHVVIEAYFACEKNEELAANYLFENGFDDNQ